MTDKKEVLLKVEHLEQYFRLGKLAVNKAVDDVSFDIYKGEVFGLVGESGCGKTTTGRSVIRLYDITGGSVYFKGQRICAGIASYKREIKRAREEYGAQVKRAKSLLKKGELTEHEAARRMSDAERDMLTQVSKQTENIAAARFDHNNCNRLYAERQMQLVKEKYEPEIEAQTDEEKKRELEKEYKKQLRLAGKDRIMNKMQMIFQDPIASLDPRMTVREIIAEGLTIRGIKDRATVDEKVYEVLRLVGLVPEHAGRYPHEFSGGQRQRIGIARAVILNPELIIADEPVSALDVSVQAQVINLLNDLRRELGLTILFIAHNLSVVKYFSDRIAVMYFGKIVELASSAELFEHPLHPYTKSLLSAIPVPDPKAEKKRRRILYNPIAEHDYSVDKPTMREISEGHFVYCNDEEEKRYRAELSK